MKKKENLGPGDPDKLCRTGSPGDSHESGAIASQNPAPQGHQERLAVQAFGEIYEIETVDNTYRDSTTLIVRRYEQGGVAMAVFTVKVPEGELSKAIRQISAWDGKTRLRVEAVLKTGRTR